MCYYLICEYNQIAGWKYPIIHALAWLYVNTKMGKLNTCFKAGFLNFCPQFFIFV